MDRTVLPIPDRPRTGLTTYDAKDPATSFAPIEPLRPPKGAPNVLLVLIDDAGFGSSSAFGGPCQTPTAERLAGAGLKFNRFHTTALCSPTSQKALMPPDKPFFVYYAPGATLRPIRSDRVVGQVQGSVRRRLGRAAPVSDDYGIRDSEFTGTVRWVQIDLDAAAEDMDHLISAEERLRVAMARQ